MGGGGGGAQMTTATAGTHQQSSKILCMIKSSDRDYKIMNTKRTIVQKVKWKES
jgi:hypothetical protein